ncbi:MAG: PQQ-binding-like beta-propeller repeat protein [Burkholderiaceae bacterium]
MKHLVAPVVLALTLAFGASARAQWAQEGGGPAKRYANTEETVLARGNVAGLTLQWQRQIGQFYASAVTQAGPQLLVCSNLHRVSGLQPATGHTDWDQLAGVADCGTPASAGGRSYLVSSTLSPNFRNVVSALDSASGAVLWEVDLPASSENMGLNAGPVVDGGRVYVSSDRGQIVALDAADGHLLWQATTGGNGVMNNDPSVDAGRVFVTTWNECCYNAPRQLHAYDAATGAELWARAVDASNMQYPALVLGKNVVVGTDAGAVKAYEAATGKLRWSRDMGPSLDGPLAAQGQAIYARAGTSVAALDAKTGATLWTRTLPKGHRSISNAVWANGLVYVVGENFSLEHVLFALNAGSGKPAASVPLTGVGSYARLSVADGRVYLNSNGTLSALGL